ncbi:MAG TPA: aldehyde dehydrogenase family protein [Candidatus Acidoferrales bacterium]|nr:aldehyde dehydrogenase family protein [Candidatus Acidoferrales bacterium]
MQLRDRDLVSIQEARELAAAASAAQQKFSKFSQEQVDAVVEAASKAAAGAAEVLARAAVEETGFGNVPDKIIKNQLGAIDVARAIRGMRTVGIVNEDRERKIVEVAVPVGVICAIIPSTNPTSTAIYKTLISLKSRNGIVLSPHPSAIRCICQTAKVLSKAAAAAGAPDGLIQCMERTSLAGTQELMRAPQVAMILATGGTGLVRAAYSSGKPAYGVGPGNVPAFIERTADLKKAVADIFAGKTFDYGTICSSEQAVVVEEPLREAALVECMAQGGFFLNEAQQRKLEELLFPGGAHAPSPKLVGRPATHIAELAGITVPAGTRVLLAQLSAVGRDAPLSAEKLSPILAYYSAPNLAAGIDLCTQLLRFGGLGHTAAIHTKSEEAAKEYGKAVPAFRVCVNTSAVHGSIGYSTNLFPAMTLGCGALGGNITSDNIGPKHLMNVRRVAWESREVAHRTIPAEKRMEALPEQLKAMAAVASAGSPEKPSETSQPQTVALKSESSSVVEAASAGRTGGLSGVPSRGEIAHAVEHVMAHLGIQRRGAMASGERSAGSIAAGAPKTPESKSSAQTQSVLAFVSENDVRRAITRSEKILIGPKTIVTPSARDLASGHDGVLVMSDAPVANSAAASPGE